MGGASAPPTLASVVVLDETLDWERDGIIGLRGAFDPAAAVEMRRVLWRELEKRHGILEHDPSTWTPGPAWKLETTKKSAAFAPMLSDTVRVTLDGLFGPGRWKGMKHAGQVLVSFPHAEAWVVPHELWHSDFETEPATDGLFGVKHWSFFGSVAPGGGGTPQIAGSHKLFARYLETAPTKEYKKAKHGFMRSHPWLKGLSTEGDVEHPGDRMRFLEEHDVDGLPARVVELTGEPGDVFITHPWVFHSIAVNAGDRPRMIRSGAFRAVAPS